ncbi:CIS tube protein [Mastigocoleus testarum]|uniref:Peptidoglycan-binding protein n=1 Tax=Mastigocoleus testarum BC008 TaxID=371196 RepID=A0A0V7ZJW3_9CYAN|nr:LysM peptidoglycan-binding domain-containing protein [Mastigocoleus testarum]KST62199.1 peptidoglycan-binding protein [Mastigocoleus testarum BC008]KST64829.1 peptidoglycan-binding protein [Mastigocoleus testarum BC008]
MALEKAFILAGNGDLSRKEIEVLFNPTEYSLETSNQFQRTAVPGTATPATQFVNGNTQTLTMDLFFDSYERGEDVRSYTTQVTSLLDIDPILHAPPICEFRWGSLSFRATLEQVNQTFTLFLESGVPVRATLSVTFKEYKTLSEQIQGVRKESSADTKRIIPKQGDSLWMIANKEYKDSSLWRLIANANKISNPRLLTVAQELIVPVLK